MEAPLILVTNDDGIDSSGLWAVAEAVLPLGEVLVVAPDRANGEGRPGYRLIENVKRAEPGSDIHTLLVDRMVSVTPLSLDLTSRIPLDVACRQLPELSASSAATEGASEIFPRLLPSAGSRRCSGRSGLPALARDARPGIVT
jgi:hypothetical protein